MDAKTRQRYLVISFISAVILGAVYGIFQKMLYLTKGEKEKFDHPYFVSFLLCVSMVMVFPIYLAKEVWNRTQEAKALKPLSESTLNETLRDHHNQVQGENTTVSESMD